MKKVKYILMLQVFIFIMSYHQPVKADEVNLSNPIIQPIDYLESGQKITWDCIYLGSYPQAEVITKKLKRDYAVSSNIICNKDVIVDDNLYMKLSSKKCIWDGNNETVLNGLKYRRVKAADIARIMEWDKEFDGGYIDQPADPWKYYWKDKKTYHYFCYEPIKWRVLQVKGGEALLLSDLALDSQEYNTKVDSYISYGACSLRKWMNSVFFDTAFEDIEKTIIKSTQIEYPVKYGSSEMACVDDKVFLLSGTTWTNYSEDSLGEYSVVAKYGFAVCYNTIDNARMCRSSTFAKAMGMNFEYKGEYAGNCEWYIHDQSMYKREFWTGDTVEEDCGCVCEDGTVHGATGSFLTNGFRACIRVDANNRSVWRYAGTVSSDDLLEGQELIDNTSGAYYRVTKADGQDVFVDFLKLRNKKQKYVKIPDSVMLHEKICIVSGIASNAFNNCKNIKSIDIGNNVEKVGKNAFKGCKSLKTITVKSTKLNKKSIGKNAFKGINTKATFKCPKKQFKNYKKWIKKAGAPKTAKYKK